MRPDGFAPLLDVSRIVRVREDRIREVCTPALGEKQRFELLQEGGTTWIRATHGHSDPRVTEAAAHRPLYMALATLVHGTHAANMDSILKEGLRSMGRRHIHFIDSDTPEAVAQGFREQCDRLLYVDMAAAIVCGMEFFRAPDGTVVSQGFNGVVPPKFILKVCTIDGGAVPMPPPAAPGPPETLPPLGVVTVERVHDELGGGGLLHFALGEGEEEELVSL